MTKISEKELMDGTRLALQDDGCTMFRNNVGVATFQAEGQTRTVRYGLSPGSSDLIGWTEVTVTQAMVGSKVALFTALEGKQGEADLGTKQRRFIDGVLRAGGIAGKFSEPPEARSWVRIMVDMIKGGERR